MFSSERETTYFFFSFKLLESDCCEDFELFKAESPAVAAQTIFTALQF